MHNLLSAAITAGTKESIACTYVNKMASIFNEINKGLFMNFLYTQEGWSSHDLVDVLMLWTKGRSTKLQGT